MRVEFLNLIESNETFAKGLFTLSHLLEKVEINTDDYNDSFIGLHELVRLLAKAAQKQSKDMEFVLENAESEQH